MASEDETILWIVNTIPHYLWQEILAAGNQNLSKVHCLQVATGFGHQAHHGDHVRCPHRASGRWLAAEPTPSKAKLYARPALAWVARESNPSAKRQLCLASADKSPLVVQYRIVYVVRQKLVPRILKSSAFSTRKSIVEGCTWTRDLLLACGERVRRTISSSSGELFNLQLCQYLKPDILSAPQPAVSHLSFNNSLRWSSIQM